VVEPAEEEAVELAIEVVKQMLKIDLPASEFAPSNKEIRELVQARMAGHTLAPAAVEAPEPTVDLMRTLRAEIRAQGKVRKEVKKNAR
jgi:non-homologous end joining protein Ku